MLLLTSMLTLAFNVQPVKASGTIYIRADGSVDPQTTPILNVRNVYYTFTADIHDSIVVERDNIVIDGAGYTVQEISKMEKLQIVYLNNSSSYTHPSIDTNSHQSREMDGSGSKSLSRSTVAVDRGHSD